MHYSAYVVMAVFKHDQHGIWLHS